VIAYFLPGACGLPGVGACGFCWFFASGVFVAGAGCGFVGCFMFIVFFS